MEYVAFVSGLAVSYFLAKRAGHYFLILFYHFNYRNRYEEIFDLHQNEPFYEVIRLENKYTITYADHLYRHQLVKPFAQEKFTSYWNSFTKLVTYLYVYYGLLPGLIFFKYYPYYLLGIVIYHIVFFAYSVLIKEHDVIYNYRILYLALVTDVTENELAKEK
ncbi:TPA: hypothetical protein EYO12_01115 [Candidatus Saccharibacteria bacterium]|nr:hypothetical protein [Candidatus Saccharibacteria bacterium]HIO87318.1 hypothetical protein [Candidatus Saccharibacteria bacterium]